MTSGPTIEPFLGLEPEIDETAYIASTAAIIGAVRLGPNVSIWHQVTLRGDANFITVGANTNIQDNAVVHIDSGEYPTRIGKDVTIGHSAIIHACTLEDCCFVGMGAIVMDGAVVEREAMVGAGALIPPGKVVTSGTLWVGNPGREVRALTDKEKQALKTSAERYVEFGRAARLGDSAGPFTLFETRSLPPLDKS